MFSDPRLLLYAVLTGFPLGLAICDRQLRFQFINEALASMNGPPVAAHLGKGIHEILGSAAEQVQPLFERVFATGEPTCNVYVTAQLPTRPDVGHWLESYIPLRNHTGKITEVAAVVVEITEVLRLKMATKRLAKLLCGAEEGLRNVGLCSVPEGLASLLKQSVSQAQAIHAAISPSLLAVAHTACASTPQVLNGNGRRKFPSAPRRQTDQGPVLSCRKQEVLEFLAQGYANKVIASSLAISVRTVETYRARLMLKLGLHSVPQLVRYAIRNNVI